MSTVKLDCNFKSRTATLDSLKISLPKVHDDPYGSSSSLITSVCPCQSNFRGSTPDSPVLTSPKTRAKPYGSLSARGCSDVHDRADLPISSFSLGCSTDHHTAASMVIAHKVGCYTGKASLYARNSFIPEDVSSVLILLMADLVMNSYLSFPGLVELIVPPEVVLAYGSLPRPPENYFFPCSWSIYSDLVCKFLLTLLTINGVDIAALWPSLARRYAHREGELMLSNLNQNHDCGDAGVMFLDILTAFCSISETDSSLDMVFIDLFRASYVIQEQQIPPDGFISQTILQLFSAHVLHRHVLKCLQISGVNQLKHFELVSHVAHLLTASYVLRFLKTDSRFVSTYWLSQHHDVVYGRSEEEVEYTSLATASWELDWFCNLLYLLIYLVPSVLFFCDDQAVLHSLNRLVSHELLLQQSWTQAIPQRQSSMLLVCSRWSILDFLYGSLPRPPDIFLKLISFPYYIYYGVFHVQDVMAYILRGSIKYHEVVYALDYSLVNRFVPDGLVVYINSL